MSLTFAILEIREVYHLCLPTFHVLSVWHPLSLPQSTKVFWMFTKTQLKDVGILPKQITAEVVLLFHVVGCSELVVDSAVTVTVWHALPALRLVGSAVNGLGLPLLELMCLVFDLLYVCRCCRVDSQTPNCLSGAVCVAVFVMIMLCGYPSDSQGLSSTR